MKKLQLVQGTPEWHAARAGAGYRGSSAAAAMMGASDKISRSDLVRMRALGTEQAFSAWVQENLIDRGHETEETARPFAEEDLGEDLYRVTATSDDGYLIASFDGITMDERRGWEHKLWNEKLAAAVRAKDLPATHYWQLEHQLDAGQPTLEEIVFTVSDGTRDKMVSMVYRAVPGRREALRAGWRQFDEDVANYQHVEVLPRASAAPVRDLPAIVATVTGDLTVKSNLEGFGEQLTAYIEGLPTHPETDQEFADLEAGCKALQRAQDALEGAKASALAQVAPVEQLCATVDSWAGLARTKRLTIEKLVTARKEAIRAEIKTAGQSAIATHLAALDKRLSDRRLMPNVPHNLLEVMKGKKTVKGLRDAVDAEIARVKIEANAIADRIQANIAQLAAEAPGLDFLFADLAQIVQKAPDDFTALVALRKANHAKTEADRIEKIRAEERAKLEASQQERPPAPTPGPNTAQTPAPHQAFPVVVPIAGQKPARPTDEEILWAIAERYAVSESIAAVWLLTFDFTSLQGRIPKSVLA